MSFLSQSVKFWMPLRQFKETKNSLHSPMYYLNIVCSKSTSCRPGWTLTAGPTRLPPLPFIPLPRLPLHSMKHIHIKSDNMCRHVRWPSTCVSVLHVSSACVFWQQTNARPRPLWCVTCTPMLIVNYVNQKTIVRRDECAIKLAANVPIAVVHGGYQITLPPATPSTVVGGKQGKLRKKMMWLQCVLTQVTLQDDELSTDWL